MARLENADRAFCFSSGLAAISAVARLLSVGDEILAGDDLYGGTYRLFSRILDRTGVTVRYADACDVEKFAAQITSRTRLLYIETPTNPLLRIVDIRKLADLAHQHGALLCVDSSAMSPYLQNPLDLGADIVVHSATKYLCGHSDVTAGVVAVKRPELAEQIYFIQNGEGAALGPFDCYLLLRGVKTLKLRLDCQQANALKVANFLTAHPAVQRVHYPGLASHPGHDVHVKQARGAGAVISFETGSFDGVEASGGGDAVVPHQRELRQREFLDQPARVHVTCQHSGGSPSGTLAGDGPGSSVGGNRRRGRPARRLGAGIRTCGVRSCRREQDRGGARAASCLAGFRAHFVGAGAGCCAGVVPKFTLGACRAPSSVLK